MTFCFSTNYTLFQPGDSKEVTLVSIGGRKIIRGGNGLADGAVDDSRIEKLLEDLIAKGFKHADDPNSRWRFSILH